FYAITNLFGIGASSLMSRAMGAKEPETVKKASATGLYFALLGAILIAAGSLLFRTPLLNLLGTDEVTFAATKDYMFWTVSLGSIPCIMSIMFSYLLRAEGHSLSAGIGQISGCVLNIILDPFFILPFGLNLGAAGAGLATFIANCVTFSYFVIFMIREKEKTQICLKPSYISFERPVFGSIIVVGVPGVFQNILNVISMTILNNIVAGYGPDVVAAVGISSKINQLPIQIVFGFTQGVMPLIGYNYAGKNFPRMKETIKKTYALTLSVLIAVLALFSLAGQPLVRVFMDNDVIVTTGARFLQGFGLSLPFMCIDFMVVGISQSFGKGKHALVFSFLRKLALEIPLILFLNHMAGVAGIAYAQCLAEFTMAIIAISVQAGLLKECEE
ncbi:MAG: MATE family efflux transporter, partial [Lachnospiraceae bacterium]|nr:MATE family efflux transporter [Lachnospiraceae bacterium]